MGTPDDTGPTGAIRGQQFLDRLNRQPRAIWHRGKLIADIVEDRAFKGGVRTLATLFDLQWEKQDIALFKSPSANRLVGCAFMAPTTHDELRTVSRTMEIWEDTTHGWMGRLPTYLSRASMGLAVGAAYFAEADPTFGKNVTRHYQYVRDNDLTMTSTFSTPQINRSALASNQDTAGIVAHVKKETDAGLIISGCKTLATLPIADELLVYSGAPLKDTKENHALAFIFSIPTHAEGLTFICRESVDEGRSRFDSPLGSRFEENDAVVIFNDVLVPWDRVFMYRDIERCNSAFSRTGALVHMDHQVVVKNIAKTKFLLGLISLMVNSISIEIYQHIYEKLAEVWLTLETMKAFLYAAEAEAELDEWNVLRPAADPLIAASLAYTRAYPRIIEIIQQIGASGLIMMPTQADIEGPCREDIKRYYQSSRAEALEKIPLFRLAWDVSMSAFGSRQVLYERFSRGDPIRVANALVITRQAQFQLYADRVVEFINNNQEADL